MKRPKTLLFTFGVALFAALLLVLHQRGFFTVFHSVQAFQEYVLSFSPYSHLCFFLLQLLSVVAAPIPSNLSAAAGGLLFGTWPAFFLTFAAVLIGSMGVFFLSRLLGRPFADRFVSRRLSQKYLSLIREKTATFLFLAFLFPYFPDDVLCILAGLTSISSTRFFFIVLFARPWGLLFASALGGAAISLPLWALVLLGVCGAALFLLGMKYAAHVEGYLLSKLGRIKKFEKV